MSVSSTGSVSGPASYFSGNANQPNLSAIIDDTTGKYSDDQKVQAYQEREARDEAVMIPAFQQGMATGDSTLPWRAWIKFLNTLSPEEQNSPRYRGTRQEALAAIAAGNGPNPVTSGPAGTENVQFGVEEPSKKGTHPPAPKVFVRLVFYFGIPGSR